MSNSTSVIAPDPMIRALLGRIVLVRINQIDSEDQCLSTTILAGRVLKIDPDEGCQLSSLGQDFGEIFYLPYLASGFVLIEKGLYALSDHKVIQDPDFLLALDQFV